jgi:hypothetical protein
MIFHSTTRIVNFARVLSLFVGSLFLFTACSGQSKLPDPDTEERISVITGTSKGIKLLDIIENDSTDASLPVNALLWRAALDVSSYVPLDDIDTFGGSIVTEWYAPKGSPDRRLKLTIFVIGRELRSDAIRVRAYVQKRLGTDWIDAGRDETLSRDLEELILSRARELRAAVVAETVN